MYTQTFFDKLGYSMQINLHDLDHCTSMLSKEPRIVPTDILQALVLKDKMEFIPGVTNMANRQSLQNVVRQLPRNSFQVQEKLSCSLLFLQVHHGLGDSPLRNNDTEKRGKFQLSLCTDCAPKKTSLVGLWAI